MADAEPLFALLEIMLRTFNVNVPKMKPGGHPDDIFLRLTDEEREELECSICYQVMKEVRQCANNHRFCYSCIYVWSTSGSPVNHGRCPVCRTEGNYARNAELEDKINKKIVKCSTKSCKWIGSLKHLASHKHTNYNSDQTSEGQSDELPTLVQSSSTPSARSRSRASVASSQPTLTPTPTPVQNTAETTGQPRRLLANVTNNSTAAATQSRSSTNNAQSGTASQRSTNSQTTNRTRNRSRARNNSTSPQRRVTTTTTGLNKRLTSRARIHNGQSLSNSTTMSRISAPAPVPASNRNESQAGETMTQTTESALTPRPPTTPRPEVQAAARRRLPTLPSIVNTNTTSQGDNSATQWTTTPPTTQNLVSTDSNNNNNNNVNENNSSTAENPLSFANSRRNPLEGTGILRRGGTGTPRGFATVRDRLNESRQRLDMLMNAFSVELTRGRHDLTSFQQERERRRQEQLAEVRDLGVRLGQVATELRGLLSQRRQIRSQIDHLVDGGSGTEDDD